MFGVSYPELENVKVWYDKMMAIPEVEDIMKEFLKTLDKKKEFFKGTKPPAQEKANL
jgi:hypothetical protein